MATTSQARSLVTTLIIDNTTGDISPADVRTCLNSICDVADSLNAENSTAVGLIEEFDFEVRTPINTPAATDRFTFTQFAHYARTINELRVEATAATATFQISLYIDDTAVTGLTNVNVTTSSRTVANAATGSNTMSIGSRLRLAISGIVGNPLNMSGSIKWTRS